MTNWSDHAFVLRAVLYFSALQKTLQHVLITISVMQLKKLIYTLPLVFLAQACGQTGPLYLPDSPPPVYIPKQVPVEEE